jgi:aryl-alcohol dehydrogenase-like predicted oxidoreductase
MTFGEDWGWGASKEESRKIFDAFSGAGGNFIDTSNNYTNGSAEKFIGEFIASEREGYVVASKYSLNMRKGDPNAGGNQRKNMMQAVEGSLKRLGSDYIDLYYLHMWDHTTPIDEVMRAFDDLVRAGKVLYAGLSDTPAWIASSAQTMADLRGWPRLAAIQAPYSLADRALEREIFPMAKQFGMAALVWGLLEAGELTGKYNTPSDEPRRNSQASPKNLALAETVMAVAQEVGRSPAQVAINWVRRQQDKALIIPIIGSRSERHIKDNIACLDFTLSDEQVKRLADASPIDLGFPSTFFGSDGVKDLIFGGTYHMIDHRS